MSLCNALLRTSHTNPADVKVNTLNWTFFSNIRNDLSCFFLNRFMILMEHQHTWNENMPIRLLLYVAEEYKLFIANHARNLYRSTLMPLPAPNFYCFYDGRKEMPPRKILRLSDAFGEDISALELQVRMISLKAGQNEDLKEKF